MSNLILNGSFLLLVFLAVTAGVLLMTGKVKLDWIKRKGGRREYGPILWPCPTCHEKVHKNMVLDHYCTL
jgi:hypothetical protein